ncbi:MAG: FkbM family methyltransferase [Myxococcota bacterium]|jgi:FkbM family methyltransferase|nr:FkbM family methyltransferase [Myxococcota bacterium]
MLERLSRGRAFKRRLPAEFGRTPIYVSPDSQLKYLKPGASAFDLELLRVAREELHNGDVVWDIGANVGVFTFAAASRTQSGDVLAVEPDIWLAGLLRKSANLGQNRGLGVRVLPTAIAGEPGMETFLVAERGRASNALSGPGARGEAGGVREQVLVPTLSLDLLLSSNAAPSFIKIDVEGAEKLVLEGATRVLSAVRPTIYIEVGGGARDAVTALLKDNDYRLYDGALAKGEERSIERCTFNTLAFPSENDSR